MPSKYGKEFAVPKEFPSILKAFTRECLRSQPQNIYEFGVQYFTELQFQEQAAYAAADSGPRRLTKAELEELLNQMFKEADTDNSGALSLTEFKEVLKMADLGLPEKEAKKIMAEADVDGNGDISYEEFVPLAVEIVYSMYARMEADAKKTAEEDAAREEASNFLVHGMTKSEVEGMMGEIFVRADVDGSGALSITEFQKCCQDAGIGLTRKEINVLMHQCDVDGDGNVSYDEFVPLCYELLVEIMKDELLQNKRDGSELCQFLLGIWREADTAGTGALDAITLKTTLARADLGLSKVQLHSVLSQGVYDEEGLCDYATFASDASEIIYRLLDPDEQMERYQAIQALESADFSMVHGLGKDDVYATLMREFDAASGGSGYVTVPELKAVLSSSSLGLSPTEIVSLQATAAPDASGSIQYALIAEPAFYILQYLAQNAAISN